MPSSLTVADVRLVLADIPVHRPDHTSFTTLEAVNFVLVRLETRDADETALEEWTRPR